MMDRPRRLLLAIPIVTVVAVMLIGAIWLGCQIGDGLRAGASPSPSPTWASDAEPGLLPATEMVRCSRRLDALDGDESTLALGDLSALEPPPYSVDEPPAAAARAPQPTLAAESRPTVLEPARCQPSPKLSSAPMVASPATRPAESRQGSLKLSSMIPTATPWATPYRPGERSPRLEQSARQADYHTRRGFDLATRKAYHSARAEFVRALRLVAQSLDTEHKSQVHSRALSAGLAALEEVDDFVPAGSGLEGDLDLRDIIVSHHTPVLKTADPERLTPMQCVRRYVDYAREQLSIAAGGEVAGSIALHALGKLHWTLASLQHASRPMDDTKALVLLEAASRVCRANYLVLNDLGVLLSRGGRHAEARAALEGALVIAEDPTVLANLATVQRELGETELAEQTQQRATVLLAARGKSPNRSARPVPSVNWVSPDEFAKSYASVAGPWQPAPANRNGQPKAPAAKPGPIEPEPVKQASRGFSWDWFFKARK